jgi:GT2 family glycosyltransferase
LSNPALFGMTTANPRLSKAVEILQHCHDRSVYSEEIRRLFELSPEGRILGAVKANPGRVINLGDLNNVLLVDWENGVLPRFFAEQGLQVVVQPPCRNIAELTSTHCAGLSNVTVLGPDELTVEKSKDALDQFDLVFFRAPIEPDKAQSDSLLVRLREFLVSTGILLIAVSGKTLAGRSNELTRAFETSTNMRCLPEETLYTFPSLDEPSLLIRSGFLLDNPDAWAHIAPFLSENGLPRPPNTLPIAAAWQALQDGGVLPLEYSDRLLYLVQPLQSSAHTTAIDLLHTSLGRRCSSFRTETSKLRTSNIIRRLPIVKLARGLIETPESSGISPFDHVVGDEDYHPGRRLSDVWLDALSHPGIEPSVYLSSLEKYFEFLRENIDKTSAKPLDLLPDNIVVRGATHFRAIDQEWVTVLADFSSKIALYRGLLFFLARNGSALNAELVHRNFGETYREFVKHAFDYLNLDYSSVERSAVTFEEEFLDYSLDIICVLDIPSLMRHRFGDSEILGLEMHCHYPPGVATDIARVDIPSSIGRDATRCCFSLPLASIPPTGLTILPETGAGPFRIHSFFVTAKSADRATLLIDANSTSKVAASGQFFGIHPDPGMVDVKIPSRPVPEFVVSLESFKTELDNSSRLEILITISWPEAGYNLQARKAQLTRLWQRDLALDRSHQELKRTKTELGKLGIELGIRTAELELLKASKVWRAAEAVRAVIYGQILRRGRKSTVKRLAAAGKETPTPAAQLAAVLDHDAALPELSTEHLKTQVRISVVLPVYDTPKEWLADAVGSVIKQSYPHWELLIINDGSTKTETKDALNSLEHPQIKVISFVRNSGISAATSHGIDAASGDYIAFLDHDDILSPSALATVAAEITSSDADILYTDENIFGEIPPNVEKGYFGQPHLKPDYSPELLLSHNYITHLLVVRQKLLDVVGGPRSEFDGAQDYDLVLRLTEKTDKVAHIPKPLYHWRQSAQSTALDSAAKPAAHGRAQKALEQALSRRAIRGRVLTANRPHYFRVQHEITGQPLVSIIIPFRDQPRLLFECIDALNRCTRYQNYEVIGIDNNSEDELTMEFMARLPNQLRVRFHRFSGPFNFSEIVNYGVEQANGEHIVLLNNDIQVINNDWLEAMLEHSQRRAIGAVGAKLYYPDNTIQHAGIIVGIGGYAGHSHKHRAGNDPGYFNRLNVVQNVSAVTGAMLMCKKSIYEKVGGFDAENFAIAGNDVDFCLRLAEMGLRNVFTPYAMAYHAESVSRGYEDDPEKVARFDAEKQRFRVRHAGILQAGDPYYNPNLRLDTEGFDIKPLSGNKG